MIASSLIKNKLYTDETIMSKHSQTEMNMLMIASLPLKTNYIPMKKVMKSIFFFSLMTCTSIVLAQAAESKPFKITGTIQGNPKIWKIVATYLGKSTTVNVNNGKYTISGTLSEPTVINLQGEGKASDDRFDKEVNVYDFYLIPGTVTLQSNKTLSSTQASGQAAKWNKDYQYLSKQVKAINDDSTYYLAEDTAKLGVAMEVYTNGKVGSAYGIKEYIRDSIKYAKDCHLLNGGMDSALNYNVLIPYIKSNFNSPLALWALFNIGGFTKEYKYDIQYPLYQQLSPEIKAYNSAKKMKMYLVAAGVTEVGKRAPDLVLPDTSGHDFNFASLRGKYVLIDFWADWCPPCRAEFPQLRKTYNQYKDKGFTILAISVAEKTNQTRWKNAIIEERSNWLNVFDGGKVAIMKYGIFNGIPRNFLLDPNGVVIGRDLRGDALEKKLKELLEK
ncbi:TlpA disulfide reductase family protein [Pedobacter borealis]|uniref:TlpA disulfide reductase family protein n=1 Tax=Pedobacter borealis TaxID=475254 RepID=UPI0004938D7D|nr:TlpA disulfide reductase family protein [Pedobacter borealis]